MRVATVQFSPTFGQKIASLKRLARIVQDAASQGARLVVLPELAATGYSFMGPAEAERVAEEAAPGNLTFDVMAALASTLDVHIIYGFVERDPSGKLYNSQAHMPPTKVITKYAKINKWGNDYLWAESGRANPPVVDVDGVRVGLLICRDVRDKVNDDWKDLYSPGDADVVCLSANWGRGGFPAVAWMDFVEENKTALVISNRYGTESHNDFGEGGICIIDKSGKVQCEGLQWGQDCIVYGEL